MDSRLKEEKIKIKIDLAGRLYPLNIIRDEEEIVRKAGNKVNEVIQIYEENYEVKDKQDVLAMSALQFASEIEFLRLKKSEDYQKAIDLTQNLNSEIDSILKL